MRNYTRKGIICSGELRPGGGRGVLREAREARDSPARGAYYSSCVVGAAVGLRPEVGTPVGLSSAVGTAVGGLSSVVGTAVGTPVGLHSAVGTAVGLSSVVGTAVGASSEVGTAVGLRRPLMVGAAVGARQDGEDLGAPMTARESSTAKGNARFFAVLAGAGADFCAVEEIEWTIVEV